jgi:predicted regulator of Ras-like GTPase activity (Roadblock/LC7/MglB family)
MDMDELLDRLRRNSRVSGSAVISRDGVVVASDCPEDVANESFAIMCATVMGAAKTINTELKMSELENIILHSNDGNIILMGAGRRNLLVVIADNSHPIETITSKMAEIVNEMCN